MTTAISVRNLDVVFGKNTAKSLKLLDEGKTRQEIIELTGDVVGVQNANIDIAQGEICVLMGLSGSGKSSLLRAVNGLNTTSRGQLLVLDGEEMVDIAQADEKTLRHMRANRVSMVFQKFALMPWLTVVDNVAFGLEMMGVSKAERRERARAQLEMVGLGEWLEKYPHELSGGMQQRVGLARAFTMDSDILLMDEPFSALDPLIRAQLQDELIDLQKKLNKTILFVSHDLDEALKIGTHIAIMESAQIIQHGTPEDIVLNPCNAYVEDFVAHTNPLNVLVGRTLMTQVSELSYQGERLVIDPSHDVWVELEAGRPVRAGKGEQALTLAEYDSTDSQAALPGGGQLVSTQPDVSMRQAIELCYENHLPVLLVEDGLLVGVLRDDNYYHALLGKHFTSAE